MQAGDLQRKRAVLLVRASNKREQAFMEAHERGEWYAKQKLKMERKGLEVAQKEVGFLSRIQVCGGTHSGLNALFLRRKVLDLRCSRRRRSWLIPKQILCPKH